MQPLRLVVCAVQMGETPGAGERPHPQRRRDGLRRRRERRSQPLPPLREVAVRLPEGDERRRQPQPDLPFPALLRPAERRAQVALLPLEAHQPSILHRPVQRRCGPFREGQREHRPSRARRIGLATRDELFQPILSHGFEQAVPRLLARAIDDDQRLVHQPRQDLEDCGGGQVVTEAHRLHRFERELTGEHRQATEQRALQLGEQGITPIEGGAQRLLARRRDPAAPDQHAERIVEAGKDLREREDPDARRRKFEGEGDAVEAGADARDDRGVLSGEGEGGDYGLCPDDEELHRGRSPDPVHGRRVIGVGEREGRHPVLALVRDLQRFAAGGEDAERGAGSEELIRKRGTGVDQVLAVVEDEQGGPVREERTHVCDGWMRRRFVQPEEGGHGAGDERGIDDWRQFDQPNPMGKGRGEIGCELGRESGLAAAADAREREQARIRMQDQVAQRGERVVAANQCGTCT